MATRLYFHAAADNTSGLPTTEQSTLTANVNIGPQADNHQMTITIGTSQTEISGITNNAAAISVYFTKFVSPPLNQTSVAANTWTYNFATMEDAIGCNFPVNGSGAPIRVNCYVWRPSNQTKVGTILDGNTASNLTEPSADTEACHNTTFTGAAVSSVQSGDVIILEVWCAMDTSASGASEIIHWYYDGTTVNTTPNATVSNHASFLETPENLTFVAGNNFQRTPSTETTTISDSSLTRIQSSVRLPSTDTTTVTAGTLSRMLSSTRVPSTDSSTVTDSSLTNIITRAGIPSADSISITDSSLVRLFSSTRVPEADTTTVIDGTLGRTIQSFRSLTPESISINESSLIASKAKSGIPSPDTTIITDSSLVRMLSSIRLPDTDTITIVDSSLTRAWSTIRIPSTDTITVGENVSGGKLFERDPSADTITIADSSLTRLLFASRQPSSDDITIGDNLARLLSASRSPSLDSMDITDSPLNRLLSVIRLPTQDTILLDESVSAEKTEQQAGQYNRSVNDNVTVSDFALTRLLSMIRSLLDIESISEVATSISRHAEFLEITDSTEVSLNRAVIFARALEIESVSVGESIFYTGGIPTGLVAYAVPDDVRPLLGNIGNQRTNTQIELAIAGATDEINRKTNRIPPNDWKVTDEDFDLIKKIARYKAALEMSIGIKDFEDRALMQKEIDEMFMIIEQHDPGGATSNDMVISSEDTTFALNPQGIIWSTRYSGLKKSTGTENDTTINPDT